MVIFADNSIGLVIRRTISCSIIGWDDVDCCPDYGVPSRHVVKEAPKLSQTHASLELESGYSL